MIRDQMILSVIDNIIWDIIILFGLNIMWYMYVIYIFLYLDN